MPNDPEVRKIVITFRPFTSDSVEAVEVAINPESNEGLTPDELMDALVLLTELFNETSEEHYIRLDVLNND